MSEIKQVPPKTPIIDALERIPKVGPVLGGVLRAVRPWWRRRHERKIQDQIDKQWHDRFRDGEAP